MEGKGSKAFYISIAKSHKQWCFLQTGLFPPQRLQVLRKQYNMEIGFFVLIIWGMSMWTFTVVFTFATTEKGKKKKSKVQCGTGRHLRACLNKTSRCHGLSVRAPFLQPPAKPLAPKVPQSIRDQNCYLSISFQSFSDFAGLDPHLLQSYSKILKSDRKIRVNYSLYNILKTSKT